MAPSRRPFSRRSAGAAVWRENFYFFGGFGAGGSVALSDVSAELWCYDGSWKVLTVGGPGAARYASLCVHDDALYLFGGCGEVDGAVVFYDHVWRYDGLWREVACAATRPPRRYAGALVEDRERLILYGGMSQVPGTRQAHYHGDMWSFTPSEASWRPISQSAPNPGERYGFGWVADEGGFYIFGGYDGIQEWADLWRFEFASDRWQCLAPSGPPARYCPALGLVAGQLILFGGRSKTNPKLNYSDSWIFDGAWRAIDSPGPGYHAKSATASANNQLWLFGGEGSSGHVSDLWRFGRDGWKLLQDCRSDDPLLW